MITSVYIFHLAVSWRNRAWTSIVFVYLQVSKGFGAWAVHWMVLKALMYVLGASAAIPFLELASYAGYPFVPACIAMLARMTLGAQASFHTRAEPLLGPLCCCCTMRVECCILIVEQFVQGRGDSGQCGRTAQP